MANATPHTHEMTIHQPSYRSHSYVINYGDQTKVVWSWVPGWKNRIQRKAKRIIKAHDKGSLDYAKRAAATKGVAEKMNEVLLVPNRYGRPTEIQGAWGSDPKTLEIVQAEVEAHKMHDEFYERQRLTQLEEARARSKESKTPRLVDSYRKAY